MSDPAQIAVMEASVLLHVDHDDTVYFTVNDHKHATLSKYPTVAQALKVFFEKYPEAKVIFRDGATLMNGLTFFYKLAGDEEYYLVDRAAHMHVDIPYSYEHLVQHDKDIKTDIARYRQSASKVSNA